MRGITTTMVDAFYRAKPKKMDNTRVTVEVEKGRTWVKMYLHGNCIAKRKVRSDDGTDLLLVSASGWSTNTTKERLNGVIGRFGLQIWQKNFDWYMIEHGGDEVMSFNTDSRSWTVVYATSPTEQLYAEVTHGRDY